jgi:hypothetical protein
MTTTLQQLTAAQANKEVAVNRNFETLSAVGMYGYRQSATTGLTFAYYGGHIAGSTIANGTVSLTNAADNRVVAHRTTGAVTAATNDTNWNDTTTYGRLFRATTAGSVITVLVDWREQSGGWFDRTGVAGAVDAANVTYTPASDTEWTGGTDPGDVDGALDQLVFRVKTIETAGSGTAFGTVVVSGQSDVVADAASDTLTLVAGSNITITTNAGTDTVTIASTAGAVATDAIWDAAGDLVQGTGANTAARLALGTAGQVLKVNAGATAVEWGAGAGDVATDAIWDAAGDLAVGSGANTAAKLSKGTALQVLRVNAGATTLEWAAPSGSTAGLHDVAFPAGAMCPRTTNGAVYGVLNIGAGKPEVPYYSFDPTTQQFVTINWEPPKSWNEGTVTAVFKWAHPATATNFGVTWGIRGGAFGDGENLDAAFGTEQEVADTGGSTSYLYVSAATSAMTIANTPATRDNIQLEIYRDPADGSDTMAVAAYLVSVTLFMTTDAETDA